MLTSPLRTGGTAIRPRARTAASAPNPSLPAPHRSLPWSSRPAGPQLPAAHAHAPQLAPAAAHRTPECPHTDAHSRLALCTGLAAGAGCPSPPRPRRCRHPAPLPVTVLLLPRAALLCGLPNSLLCVSVTWVAPLLPGRVGLRVHGLVLRHGRRIGSTPCPPLLPSPMICWDGAIKPTVCCAKKPVGSRCAAGPRGCKHCCCLGTCRRTARGCMCGSGPAGAASGGGDSLAGCVCCRAAASVYCGCCVCCGGQAPLSL